MACSISEEATMPQFGQMPDSPLRTAQPSHQTSTLRFHFGMLALNSCRSFCGSCSSRIGQNFMNRFVCRENPVQAPIGAASKSRRLCYTVGLILLADLYPGQQAQASQVIPWSDVETAYNACANVTLDRLHPYSLEMLSALSQGILPRDDPENQFLRSFTMPNSDYERVGTCILGFLRTTRSA